MSTPSQREYSLVDRLLPARGRFFAALTGAAAKVSTAVLGRSRATGAQLEQDPSPAASRLKKPKRPTSEHIVRERLRFDEQDDIGPEELAERRQEVMRLAQELREQARVPQQDRAQDEGIATTAAAPPPARKPLASDDEMSTAAASTPQRRKAHVGAPAVVGVFAGVIAATAIADASQSSGGWASAGAAVFVSAAFLCMLVMALVNRTAALLSPLLRPKFVVLVGAIAAAQWSFFMLYERG